MPRASKIRRQEQTDGRLAKSVPVEAFNVSKSKGSEYPWVEFHPLWLASGAPTTGTWAI